MELLLSKEWYDEIWILENLPVVVNWAQGKSWYGSHLSSFSWIQKNIVVWTEEEQKGQSEVNSFWKLVFEVGLQD